MGPEAKAGGHGDHWGCVVRASQEGRLLAFIARVVETAEQPEMFAATGTGMAVHSPGERLSACVLVQNQRLATAYPVGMDGHVWPVTVTEIVPWSNGIEGQITGECHEAMVSFFDTRFYVNRRRYRIGQTYNFKMSAFAYTLGPAADTEVETDMGAKVSLKGAHAYMPAGVENSDADIDDYWFHSPLEGEVSTAELAGEVLRAHPITIALPQDYEMRLIVYAAAHVIAPGTAKASVGDDLEGFLWLQGCLGEP